MASRALALEVGRRYKRRALHELFGGQWDYGISTPARRNYILLFSTDRGSKFGFDDGWESSAVYRYFGEGQRGDMRFQRGNAAILHHADRGRELHLFAEPREGSVKYYGQFKYLDHEVIEALDKDKKWRKAIVFRLAKV